MAPGVQTEEAMEEIFTQGELVSASVAELTIPNGEKSNDLAFRSIAI